MICVISRILFSASCAEHVLHFSHIFHLSSFFLYVLKSILSLVCMCVCALPYAKVKSDRWVGYREEGTLLQLALEICCH